MDARRSERDRKPKQEGPIGGKAGRLGRSTMQLIQSGTVLKIRKVRRVRRPMLETVVLVKEQSQFEAAAREGVEYVLLKYRKKKVYKSVYLIKQLGEVQGARGRGAMQSTGESATGL